MQTEIRFLGGSGPGALVRRHPLVMLAGATTLVLVRSLLGAIPSTMPGERTCRPSAAASTIEYETGVVCPPEDFTERMGYEPVLLSTPSGWRYGRPAAADGGCSGPLTDEGPFWDFGGACRAHDYGYDLVRLGVGDREAADELLYADMKRSCAANDPIGTAVCKTLADSAHAVLWAGDVSPGFEPRLEAAV